MPKRCCVTMSCCVTSRMPKSVGCCLSGRCSAMLSQMRAKCWVLYHVPPSRCAAAQEPMRSVPHAMSCHTRCPNLVSGKVLQCSSHDLQPPSLVLADGRRHSGVSRCRANRSSCRLCCRDTSRRHRPTYRHTRMGQSGSGDDGGHTSQSGGDGARACRVRPNPTRGLNPSGCRSRCSSSSPTKSSVGNPSKSSTRDHRLMPKLPSHSTRVRGLSRRV